jgi:hypothetical protein
MPVILDSANLQPLNAEEASTTLVTLNVGIAVKPA